MSKTHGSEQARKKPLVIVGAGEFAEIAFEYFTHDSDYEVVGFCVERAFMQCLFFKELPVIPVDEVQAIFPPEQNTLFVAITYTKLNRIRTRLYQSLKGAGYQFATYVSSRSFVWHNAEMGENVFIFEHNVIQSNVKLGDNIILWSGNHIGHRSEIQSNCYLASHVVVSGYCHIGQNTFIGVNATLADHVKVGKDCLIGAGTLLLKDVPEDSVIPGLHSEASAVSSLRFHRIRER